MNKVSLKVLGLAVGLGVASSMVLANEAPLPDGTARSAAPRVIDILEYRVEGSRQLSASAVEAAVAPYLGPGRTLEDIEKARAALEKAYLDGGYQSVNVAIPQQTVREGVVRLTVTEGTVGRLRVRGARWFLPSDVRAHAPSLAEGKVPNFNDVVKDMVALNQLPDRRVTPTLRAGTIPGTLDVDLNVEDTLPLHGSLGVDNRHGPDTTPIRIGATLHYDNLFQLGHSLSFTARVAPQRYEDGRIFSLSYLARVPDPDFLSFQFSAINYNSDLTTVGNVAVAGKGNNFGGRALFALPPTEEVFGTVSVGADYKNSQNQTNPPPLPGLEQPPVTMVPVVMQLVESFTPPGVQTQLVGTLAYNIRSLSSSQAVFDLNRYKASSSFFYLRGEASETRDVRGGFKLSWRLKGQWTPDALLSSEQISAGGPDSVRGYLDSETVGDFGAVGSVEFATPSLSRGRILNELRFHVFTDAGWVAIHYPLPEQQAEFAPLSVGAGARIRFMDHVHTDLDLGVPLRSEGTTLRLHPRLDFNVWTDF